MSELYRIKRIVKSLIPRTPRDSERRYSYADARLMINDLGMDLSPEVLAYLVDTDTVLEDFVGSVYELEYMLKRRATTEITTLDPELVPKAYDEPPRVVFTIQHDGEEWVFAEYTIP